MTTTISTRSARAVVGILAVSALLLTGCSGGQSKEEACSQLNSALKDAEAEVTASISEMATDPDGAIEALSDFRDTYSGTVDEITNEEVKSVGSDTTDALNTYLEELAAAANDPASADSEALMGSLDDVQKASAAVSDVCTG